MKFLEKIKKFFEDRKQTKLEKQRDDMFASTNLPFFIPAKRFAKLTTAAKKAGKTLPKILRPAPDLTKRQPEKFDTIELLNFAAAHSAKEWRMRMGRNAKKPISPALEAKHA